VGVETEVGVGLVVVRVWVSGAAVWLVVAEVRGVYEATTAD